MKEYKRLTNKRLGKLNKGEFIKPKSKEEMQEIINTDIRSIYKRLAEFEDKIENGTLVEKSEIVKEILLKVECLLE